MKKQLHLSILGILSPILLLAQWTEQATGFTTPFRGLWDISIANENTVWAVAYDGTLGTKVPEFTRTTDGGATWTPGNFPEGYSWSNISAVNGDTAWVSVVIPSQGYEGAIFKTTDGGETWTEQGVGEIFNSTSYVNFVYFWNANDGVAVGDPNSAEFEIYTTSDGGEHWAAVAGDIIPNPIGGEFGIFRNFTTLGDHIWFGTNKYRVYHSPDKGLTWSVGNTNIPINNTNYIDIAFWNENEGIARNYNTTNNTNRYVYRTNNGGTTWDPVTVNGTFFGSLYSGVAYVPGTASTLVSTSIHPNASGSSYSNDGGSTWTLIDTSVQHYVSRFWNNTTGWSAGFSQDSTAGGIFKYTGDLVHVKNTENGKDISFSVYPNPGDGHITVQLNNGENADLQISVLDLSGRMVYQNDYGVPGEFFMRGIDLSKLVKGVYILKIENGILNHLEKIIIK